MPNQKNSWEAEAALNCSIVKTDGNYTMLYRAISLMHLHENRRMRLSTIGRAKSGDGIHFQNRTQFIIPEKEWEKYGCEDPRVTGFEDKYYIFYTAISNWPPEANGIKVGLAISDNLQSVNEKHLVTPFNAKAMAMFPERINGKIAVCLTVDTDRPPAKICIAYFERPEDLWNESKWNEWYKNLEKNKIPICQTNVDHLEVGAVPVKTPEGWILIFCYVENYFQGNRIFRIDGALLDLDNPQQLIGQTLDPLLIPEAQYEMYGMVQNVIFPSSAFIEEGQLFIYYSACDTTICRSSITLNDILSELHKHPIVNLHAKPSEMLVRFENNPIISPIKNHPWESKYTFNTGAVYLGDKIHFLYRAMGEDETSVLGYAVSTDGIHIDERLQEPIYKPREHFEMKQRPGFSGCEDPRLTVMEDIVYMCYTAFDGIDPPRIALSQIKVNDFLNRNWNWSMPKLISAPGVDNKDSCIISEKINGKYIIFHRIPPCIWADVVSDLEFGEGQWLGGHTVLGPRVNSWDNLKIGLNGPPVQTSDGWLLLYHGVSREDMKYRMGAALLDLNNPLKVLSRLPNPILEPKVWYENEGYREGTVFSNGQVVKDGILYVYYGGADKYTCGASIPLDAILEALKNRE